MHPGEFIWGKKKGNPPGNLEPIGQAKINGVLTKRKQLITMKASQWGGDIHPGELGEVLSH